MHLCTQHLHGVSHLAPTAGADVADLILYIYMSNRRWSPAFSGRPFRCSFPANFTTSKRCSQRVRSSTVTHSIGKVLIRYACFSVSYLILPLDSFKLVDSTRKKSQSLIYRSSSVTFLHYQLIAAIHLINMYVKVRMMDGKKEAVVTISKLMLVEDLKVCRLLRTRCEFPIPCRIWISDLSRLSKICREGFCAKCTVNYAK